MDVQRGEDGVMVIVLDGGKLLAQQADVVIVDKGDCAHHLGGRRFPRLFDQFLADQVAKGFGAVGVSAPPDQFIELLQKDAVDGDANPAQIAHASIIVTPALTLPPPISPVLTFLLFSALPLRSLRLCVEQHSGSAPLRWHESSVRATLKATVHIPDGFLSTPVWASLDAAAAPAVGYVVRVAQRGFDDARVPLLGVMGAFVFAAQMINFPVGIGTSGHLVGGALLACTLGPAAACVVMSAILAIQALVFQDGGILALGANVINMAIVGVLAGYLPYHLWGRSRGRRAAIFAGGALSVAVAGLVISGVPMAASVLGVSLALFLVSALIEGAHHHDGDGRAGSHPAELRA